jgi:hypothetical protein
MFIGKNNYRRHLHGGAGQDFELMDHDAARLTRFHAPILPKTFPLPAAFRAQYLATSGADPPVLNFKDTPAVSSNSQREQIDCSPAEGGWDGT